MNRREFLQAVPAAAFAARFHAEGPRPPRILLRSSWQTINIGDIAHTPGVLTLLEKHLPEAEVTLWPSSVGEGVREMLLRRFPRLVIAQGEAAQKKALAECDFLLHGSGPSLVGADTVERWANETGKPYGVYGITISPANVGPRVVRLLSGASFVYFRDSVSLELARVKGVKAPMMDFGPDGAFAVDLRDDAKATAFLAEHGLEPGRFLCCLTRYRLTPHWVIPRKKTAFDPAKQAINDRWKEHDNAPQREAITRIVRETPMKVLICPEDETQMALGKEMIYDRLPDDVKPRVVLRSKFWLTDEALSVYVRSAGLFGNEMHSPIMSVGNGVPAVVCRWDTQTTKGYMWRDIGLGEWLFDFDNEEDVKRMPATALALAKSPEAARARANQARAFVEKKQRETMEVLKAEVQKAVTADRK